MERKVYAEVGKKKGDWSGLKEEVEVRIYIE
jgi:hypothetical protein